MLSKPTSRSALQQWILGLTYASIVLSLLIVGTDASMHLAVSWYSSPAVAALCIAHHITILVLSHKEGKSPRLPSIVKVWNIILISIVQLLWLLVMGVAITALQWKVRGSRKSDLEGNSITRAFVVLFIILESVVVIVITILTTLERTRIFSSKKVLEVTVGDLASANRA